ncbi:hypothetical protein AMELA_G00240630 [Ameiurus melas]|uniref:Uncharacterized protein n=1 Tax=Ameiurus melas TaxID=219545 RepID=A0A7J5ZV90_AMEME|nr:hypothetical protein AMELA_G00240630 [Ameiurus melas]
MKTGSVLLGHQGTPYYHPSNGPQQEKDCNRTSISSQAFAVGHVEPSPVTLNTNNAVSVPVSHHVPVDSLRAHPSSVMHMQQGVMSHHSQYGLYTPVYQRCIPDFLDSKVPRFQQPAASYSPCGYYPDYSVGYAHPIDQDPYWKAGDVPESRTSDMKEKEERDAILKLAEELQCLNEHFGVLRGFKLPLGFVVHNAKARWIKQTKPHSRYLTELAADVIEGSTSSGYLHGRRMSTQFA